MIKNKKEYYNKIPEWQIPINMKYVRFAKDILKLIPTEGDEEHTKIYRGIPDGVNYIFNNVSVSNFSEKAVFFFDETMLKLHHSYYRIKFSIPIVSIKEYETEETEMPQQITINKWAYDKCVLRSINKILEDHGKHIFGLTQAQESSVMYMYSPYKGLIEEVRIKQALGNDKKNSKKNVRKTDNKTNADNWKKHIQEKERFIIYCYGFGNLRNGMAFKAHGYYAVYLKITDSEGKPKVDKWKRKEDLTRNQAEIKAILASLVIAIERKYNDVEVRTSSNECIKWLNGEWKSKNEHIKPYVKKVEEMMKKIPKIQITWIDKKRNFACGV